MTEQLNLFSCPPEQLLEYLTEDTDFPVAMNYHILIALPTIEEQTRGGIYVPQESLDIAQSLSYTGRVVSIGKTVGRIDSYSQAKEIKIGDWIQYPPHTGRPMFYNGRKFLAITDQQIVAKHFNLAKQTDGVFSTYKIKGVAHGTR